MYNNLVVLLNTLLKDKNALEEFSSKENIKDLYNFCTSIVDGYSFEEFKEFLSNLAKTDCDSQDPQKIPDTNLANVSGGIGPPIKMAAAWMGGILLLSSSGATTHGFSNYSNIPYTSSNSISQRANNKDWGKRITKTSTNLSKTQKSNFKEVVNTAQKLTNTQSEVTIRWPQASEITYGQKISDSKLLDGSASVEGRFEWMGIDSNITPDAGIHRCTIVFRPYDTQKYKTSYQNINLKVNKATPRLIYKPSASNIVYGQSLSQSKFSGGKFDTEGSFSWENRNVTNTSVGTHFEKAVFKPKDTKNYNNVSFDILVTIEKAPVKFVSTPYASSITYGESLNSSRISNVATNVAGKISWENSYEILNAGTHKKTIIFKPFDSNNYKDTKINLEVKVKKAKLHLEKTNIKTTYRQGMVVSDLKLPKGWVWDKPNIRLNKTGNFKLGVSYKGDRNHVESKSKININVTKADPKLSMPMITYNENQKLKDIPLPRGWHWDNKNETPTADKSTYKASFNADEAGTNLYNSKNGIDVVMNVKKAEPKIYSWPTPASEIVYGDDLNTIQFKNGSSKLKGSFSISGYNNKLKAGNHKCMIIFSPQNPNYKEVSKEIEIKVIKNMIPGEAPDQISVKNAKRSDTSISFDVREGIDPIEFSKDGGRTWQDSPTFEDLTPNTQYSFVYRYKDTESRCTGKTSETLKITTKNSAPPAPKKINLVRYTNHEIVLRKTPGLEYSKDGGKTWQDSCEFKDLESRTEYKIVARLKESDKHVAGEKSKPLIIKTRSWLGNLWNKIVS